MEMTTHLRSSASSLLFVASKSSILPMRVVSLAFANLLASECARWFMRIARSSAALRDSEVCHGGVRCAE